MNKNILLTFMVTLALISSGCAQNISKESARLYASQISDACKEHAEDATRRGYKLIPTYSLCIDNALIYLENKRKFKEAKSKPNGKNRLNLYDIAKSFAKDKAEDAAKSKIKSI
jgi:uncharacterized protein YceK